MIADGVADNFSDDFSFITNLFLKFQKSGYLLAIEQLTYLITGLCTGRVYLPYYFGALHYWCNLSIV